MKQHEMYDELCTIGNLYVAYRKARRGKGGKWYVIEFEKDLMKNLRGLKTELESQTYEPRPLKTFVINDPKTRVISASYFRDRVVHHAVCNIIEPIFEKMFIHDSYVNRKGKGTHAALDRFDLFKRKVSSNWRLVDGMEDSNMVIGYFLKCDVRHYFESVDHKILLNIIKREISDERIIDLIRKILDNHKSRMQGKGMPIGNLTSQFFANVYLSELDYFVKHRLKARYYIRYVDDFVILHRDRNKLELWKDEINEFLKTIKLELHKEKSKIYPLHRGANFLGFRVFYHYRLLKKSNISHFMKRLDKLMELHCEKGISSEDIMKSVNGWLAYAKWANSYKLRRRVESRINKLTQPTQ